MVAAHPLRIHRSGVILNTVSGIDLSQATLVIVGHGSSKNADSAAPVHQHAQALRERGEFGQVLECFWKTEPHVGTILHQVACGRVFVVPLFISEGYFTEEVIPRELGLARPGGGSFDRVQQREGFILNYCRPVGTHPRMTEALLRRARTIVGQHPHPAARSPADIALFLAGHGTERNENSRRIIEHQAGLIRAGGIYAEVHAAFMEEQPRIADCYVTARARCIVMVPFFISDGLHTSEDIPVLLGEPEELVRRRLSRGEPGWRNPVERRGKVVWYTSAIGSEPFLSDVILERVHEAAAGGGTT